MLSWSFKLDLSKAADLGRAAMSNARKTASFVRSGTPRPARNPLPECLLEGARVPGYEDARFWGDIYTAAFEAKMIEQDRQIRDAALSGVAPGGLARADFLAISGGGDKGAFAAGVLVGWTERGDRPIFEAVTGVSAGALAAPFAFIGPHCDSMLREIYTEIKATQLYRSRGLFGFFSDALNDTTRLDVLIRHYVATDFLDRIATEYAKGRRLYVLTTNLDAQRKVIWDLSAIAASDRQDRRDLFVKILRASSALPGVFPPVRINVVATDGRNYDELHVDGGVTAELIFIPPESEILCVEDQFFATRRARSLYVIENGKLNSEYAATREKLLSLTDRAVATLVKYQVIDNLLALSSIAKTTGASFFYQAIPAGFKCLPDAPFDRIYARNLFQAGRAVGRDGRWLENPPLSPAHVASGAEPAGPQGLTRGGPLKGFRAWSRSPAELTSDAHDQDS